MMRTQGLFDKEAVMPFLRRNGIMRREEVLSGTPEQKYAFVESVAIHVDSFRQGRDFIDALFERSKRASRPGGLWILGDGGVGKSFILNDIHERYHPLDTETARTTPVLSLSFGERPAVSNILIQLLLQLGQDPDLLHYRKNIDLENYLVDAIPECGTVAILFDEAHHLWLHTTAKRNLDRKGGILGDFLKQLYDKLSVAFIFSGTPGLVDICEGDTQARTRWSGTLRLKSFEFNEKFIGLLKAIDHALPFPELSGLEGIGIATMLHASSGGNFRLLKRVLCEAVYLAALDNAPNLSIQHLEKAHFRVFCDGENPFI